MSIFLCLMLSEILKSHSSYICIYKYTSNAVDNFSTMKKRFQTKGIFLNLYFMTSLWIFSKYSLLLLLLLLQGQLATLCFKKTFIVLLLLFGINYIIINVVVIIIITSIIIIISS